MIHISSSAEFFEDLYYFTCNQRFLDKTLNCQVMSSTTANYLLKYTDRKEVFIIESVNHSVVYDGLDTWDTHMGFVFRDYKYPNPRIPKFEWIPSSIGVRRTEIGSSTEAHKKLWNKYYSLEAMIKTNKFKTSIMRLVKEN